MPHYSYRAVDQSGEVITGSVAADTLQDARDRLRNQGFYPESVRPENSGSFRLSRLLPGWRHRAAEHVAVFTRQCAVLLSSGVPVAEALRVLSQQTEHQGLSEALRDIHQAVNSGEGLAESMSRYPDLFGRSYIEAVGSGEKSGNMDLVFDRLADFLERQREMRSQLMTALIYPSILVFMTIGLLAFLSAFVIPMMRPLLKQHEGALPLSTQMLFSLASFIQSSVWFIIPGIFLLIGLFAWLRHVDAARRLFDRVIIKIPMIGKLVRKSLVSRFSRTLATLLHAGVPALEGLETLSDLLPNAAFADEISKVKKDVSEGKDISARLRNSRLFPPLVGYMVAVGERSGNLPEVLEHVSESCDREVKVASRRLLAVLEPALVLVMATVVGFVAMSLMVTLLELSNI